MTTHGRGNGGSSTHLEREHPGYVGANPHGPSAVFLSRARTVRSERELATADAPTKREIAAERPRARSTRSRANLVVRRVHLYLGLLLLPFVALYGATALLFNHATWLQPVEERALDSTTIAGSELAALTRDARATALAIVPAGIVPIDARWEGSWSFESRRDGRVERFDVDALARGGRVRAWDEEAALASALPSRFAAGDVEGWRDPALLAAQIAPRLGLRDGEAATKRAPRLAFAFDEGGERRIARWDPQNGALRVSRADGREPVDFLASLHKAHGSPGFVDARWWWSLVVDAMGFAMLAWAVTGAWLWWSIRAVRRAGLVVLLLAAVSCIALFAGMHAALPS